MYQDNREKSANKGYWYARAVSPDTIGVKELAARISNSCTVTESDIVAVITALVTEMNYALQQGNRIKIDKLGGFRVGIHSHGVADPKDFSAQKHIYNPHVIFTPTVTQDANRHRVSTLLAGIKVQEAMKYTGAGEGKAAAEGGAGGAEPLNP